MSAISARYQPARTGASAIEDIGHLKRGNVACVNSGVWPQRDDRRPKAHFPVHHIPQDQSGTVIDMTVAGPE
jgi:hypothetical protein